MAGFRFTLSHDVLGRQRISEPDGWQGAEIIQERDMEFFSVIEYFRGGAEGGFIFYGNNGVENGGIHFIKEVEQRFGFNSKIVFQAEYSRDDITYETVFEGELDLSESQTFSNNTMQVPIVRNGLWTMFINRFETPVNLSSLTDIDGNAVDPVIPVDVMLTPQAVRQIYRARSTTGGVTDYGNNVVIKDRYYQMDYNAIDVNELNLFFGLPQLDNTMLPYPWFQAEYAGNYTFDIQTTAFDFGDPAGGVPSPDFDMADFIMFYLNVDGTEYPFTVGNEFHAFTIASGRIYTFNQTITLTQGSSVRLYAKGLDDLIALVGGVWPGQFRWNKDIIGVDVIGTDETYVPCFCNITADTIYPATEAQGYLAHDVASGILARIGLGNNKFYSELLGGTDTTARQYEQNGCWWSLALFKGSHIRGLSIEEKPFYISFKEWWDGMNPMLNLGLGYETIDGEEVIRVEEKGHFIGYNG